MVESQRIEEDEFCNHVCGSRRTHQDIHQALFLRLAPRGCLLFPFLHLLLVRGFLFVRRVRY